MRLLRSILWIFISWNYFRTKPCNLNNTNLLLNDHLTSHFNQNILLGLVVLIYHRKLYIVYFWFTLNLSVFNHSEAMTWHRMKSGKQIPKASYFPGFQGIIYRYTAVLFSGTHSIWVIMFPAILDIYKISAQELVLC